MGGTGFSWQRIRTSATTLSAWKESPGEQLGRK